MRYNEMGGATMNMYSFAIHLFPYAFSIYLLFLAVIAGLVDYLTPYDVSVDMPYLRDFVSVKQVCESVCVCVVMCICVCVCI